VQTVDIFDQLEAPLQAVALLGLARALLLRLIVVVALAMVLRGSKPNERPVLLDAFADCVHSARHTRSKPKRRRDH